MKETLKVKRTVVTIFSWNAYSLIADGQELNKNITDMKTKSDVMCTQDAGLIEKLDYKIQGYGTYRPQREIGKGVVSAPSLSRT